MANLFENLDLDKIFDTDELRECLLKAVIAEGKGINGYYNAPYIRKTFKCAEIIARLAWEGENYAVSGFDTHCSGNKVWDVIVHSDITNKGADQGERKILVNNSDNHGLATINLVDADVLPSFLEGDHIKVQVVGLAEFIKFYDDEEEFDDDIPEPVFGPKIILGEGMIMPTGFLNNHDPDLGSCENNEQDDINVIRGTIKSIYGGTFEIAEQEFEPFLRFVIDTDFGELDIVAGKEMVKESEKDTIKVGMTVLAGVVLSGDVAIYDYDDGKVRDIEHDLRAIRQSICKGEAERIRLILAVDCKYVSCVGDWDVTGRDKVVNVFDSVSKARECTYRAHMATIKETDGQDSSKNLKYKPGTRCLVLENEENNYESLMFIEHDENGDINHIEVTNDSRYVFGVDMAAVHKESSGFEEKELAPLKERILIRARYLKMLDENAELNEKDITEKEKAISKSILEEFTEEGLETTKDYNRAYRDLFGRAFAVAAGHPDDTNYLKAGATFYNDYKCGNEIGDVTSSEYRAEMFKPLQYICLIGKVYAESQKGAS